MFPTDKLPHSCHGTAIKLFLGFFFIAIKQVKYSDIIVRIKKPFFKMYLKGHD
jgi:hypothetical protein